MDSTNPIVANALASSGSVALNKKMEWDEAVNIAMPAIQEAKGALKALKKARDAYSDFIHTYERAIEPNRHLPTAKKRLETLNRAIDALSSAM